MTRPNSRRVRLPGADELFRVTGAAALAAGDPAPTSPARPSPRRPATGEPSGRQRHEEKITVYVSAGELVNLERARLTLRAEHGIGVDRGRIVREALAVVLADLEDAGDTSILVQRLQAMSRPDASAG